MLAKKCSRIGLSIARSVRVYSAAAQIKGVPVDEGPSVSAPNQAREPSERVQNLVEQIANLSLVEVSDLNAALKKKLNIPDTPLLQQMAFAPAAGSAPAEAAPQPEAVATKISFTVKLTSFKADKKVDLIKKIREINTGLNLVQAKRIVESAPVDLKTDLGKNEADDLKAALEGVGGTVEIL